MSNKKSATAKESNKQWETGIKESKRHSIEADERQCFVQTTHTSHQRETLFSTKAELCYWERMIKKNVFYLLHIWVYRREENRLLLTTRNNKRRPKNGAGFAILATTVNIRLFLNSSPNAYFLFLFIIYIFQYFVSLLNELICLH